MSTPIEQIIEALDGESAGTGWICHCPAHNDNNPSLSLSQENGKTLLHCHAGCSQEAVIAALRNRGLWSGGNGQSSGGIVPDDKPPPAKKRKRPDPVIPVPAGALKKLNQTTKSVYAKKHHGEAVGGWRYHTAEGGVAFCVVRYNKLDGHKDIIPYYWTDEHRGYWREGQAYKTGRPLYRLHELIKSELPVLVVEGEKCANIKVPGYIVTTWSGGSLAVTKTDWSPLAKRTITLWPDADESGIKAALAIRNRLPHVKVLKIEGKPQGWDIADCDDPAAFIAECPFAENEKPQETPSQSQGDNFFWDQSHGLAADILLAAFGDTWIFERFDASGRGEFFHRVNCYYEPVLDAKHQIRAVLEREITASFERLRKNTGVEGIEKVYSAAGKALKKVRMKDFLSASLAMLAERITMIEIPWNATPEVIATLTGVLDFSGEELLSRPVRRHEYFRDPVPLKAEDIFRAGVCPVFDRFIKTLFPDEHTQISALHCLSLCIANKAQKIFQVWTNEEGNGGKDTLKDLVDRLQPGRTAILKGALILRKGDKSERRFGEIELRGRTAGFFDEVGGTFDIAAIKRYTSLSRVRGEAKGRDSVEFSQTWALIALCNELPRFFPATDSAFLSRLFVLPFGSVFFVSEEAKLRHINLGVEPGRLHPAKDKEKLLASLLTEHSAVLRTIIHAYLDMKKNHKGEPFESEICYRAREAYRASNDTVEKFFSEYLIRDEAGRIIYADLRKAWISFSGDQKATTREVVGKVTKRFKWTEAKATHSVRYVYGITLKVVDEDSGMPSEEENF